MLIGRADAAISVYLSEASLTSSELSTRRSELEVYAAAPTLDTKLDDQASARRIAKLTYQRLIGINKRAAFIYVTRFSNRRLGIFIWRRLSDERSLINIGAAAGASVCHK